MSALLLRDVEVDGRRVDVHCAGGVVRAVGPGLATGHEAEVVNGRGGALIPGLNDHHIHLVAAAAEQRSVRVGPPDVTDFASLAGALRGVATALTGGQWIRATGYHESVAGSLDRRVLDALVADRPVRVQHRSGALWTLSSAACRAVGLDEVPPPGAELDRDGRPNGRLMRLDGWLRRRLPAEPPPDLAALGRRLSAAGITGVTDATPVQQVEDFEILVEARLPLHVAVTGAVTLASATFPESLHRGPVKAVLADHELPSLDEVRRWITRAHASGRPIAVHCVTRVALVLALAAWQDSGVRPGDRIEHASIVPAELIPMLADLGLTVVTQPGFIAERGDQYRCEVEAADQPDLYRCRSLLAGGVRVAGSTDAPYSSPDPWRAIVAATERRAQSGAFLGADECIDRRRALDLFLAPLDDPGGPARTVRPGARADLALLSSPLDRALREPSAEGVVLTLFGGVIVSRSV